MLPCTSPLFLLLYRSLEVIQGTRAAPNPFRNFIDLEEEEEEEGVDDAPLAGLQLRSGGQPMMRSGGALFPSSMELTGRSMMGAMHGDIQGRDAGANMGGSSDEEPGQGEMWMLSDTKGPGAANEQEGARHTWLKDCVPQPEQWQVYKSLNRVQEKAPSGKFG